MSTTKSSKGFFRSNSEITSPTVRVIDAQGAMMGVFSIKQALEIAAENELDLVEVAPQASPPVCKITNAGKLKYESRKQMQVAKKKQKKVHLKEINLRPSIGENDLKIKIDQIVKFINEGDQVKISIRFRGREIVFSEQGTSLMEKIWSQISDISTRETEPKLEGKQMIMKISPQKSSA